MNMLTQFNNGIRKPNAEGHPFVPSWIFIRGPNSRRAHHKHTRSPPHRNVFINNRRVDFVLHIDCIISTRLKRFQQLNKLQSELSLLFLYNVYSITCCIHNCTMELSLTRNSTIRLHTLRTLHPTIYFIFSQSNSWMNEKKTESSDNKN